MKFLADFGLDGKDFSVGRLEIALVLESAKIRIIYMGSPPLICLIWSLSGLLSSEVPGSWSPKSQPSAPWAVLKSPLVHHPPAAGLLHPRLQEAQHPHNCSKLLEQFAVKGSLAQHAVGSDEMIWQKHYYFKSILKILLHLVLLVHLLASFGRNIQFPMSPKRSS